MILQYTAVALSPATIVSSTRFPLTLISGASCRRECGIGLNVPEESGSSVPGTVAAGERPVYGSGGRCWGVERLERLPVPSCWAVGRQSDSGAKSSETYLVELVLTKHENVAAELDLALVNGVVLRRGSASSVVWGRGTRTRTIAT